MASHHVLVVIDPTTEEQPALARGAWLAGHLGVPVELLICIYDQYLAGTRFFDSAGLEKLREKLIEDSSAALESLAREPRRSGLSVEIDARWDHPLDQGIVRKVLESNPAIVVKDTHYHPALKRGIFSNTDWNLIRACPVPLMLVRPRTLSERPTVIAAVDPLHRHDKPATLDQAIISAATELARTVEGDLHIFHSFDPAPSVSAAAYGVPPLGMDVKQIVETVRQKHEETLAELLGGYTIPEDHVHFHQGPPQLELAAAVERLDADFVVMGSVSRGAVESRLLGSTAERVLNDLPCDLLLVKPPGLGAPTA